MTEHTQPEHNGKLHKLHHDAENCLYIISMATEVLKTVRGNDHRFEEVCQSIDKERRKAADLLNEILKSVCGGCISAETQSN